jgi:TetR/AcrR family transcriptional regulator, cholesterol catabolism regulator
MVESLMSENFLLNTVYGLFTSQGIQPFTMDDIAARMAVSKKTLYRFFDSRHHLVQHVCERVAGQFAHDMHNAEHGATDNLQRVLAYMNVNIKFCKNISPVFFTDLYKQYPVDYAYILNSMNNVVRQKLLTALEQGIVEGIFRGSLHPQLIVSLMQQHIRKDFEFAAELVNDYSKDEVFRQAMYMFLYGIIAPGAIPRLEEELKKYSFSAAEKNTLA